jgi:hypothetical protein
MKVESKGRSTALRHLETSRLESANFLNFWATLTILALHKIKREPGI